MLEGGWRVRADAGCDLSVIISGTPMILCDRERPGTRVNGETSASRRIGFADRFLDDSGCAVERYTLSAALLKGSFRTRWPEAA